MVEVKGDQAIIEDLKKLGFSDEYVEAPRRLIVSSSGASKTGKTSFALSAPDPIIYFDIDIGAEGVVGKFQAEGKRVFVYHVRVPKQAKQDIYEAMWEDMVSRVRKAYSLRQGTVVWDTSSESYELCRLARFGRLTQVQPHNYVQVNNEWREILRTAYDSPMNTVLIHKLKAVWENNVDSNGRVKSTKTNKFELAGFSEMDYLAQVNIQHFREDTEEATTFGIHIKDSRHTPGIDGTTLMGLPLPRGESRVGDPLCNFGMLLNLVHGEEE